MFGCSNSWNINIFPWCEQIHEENNIKPHYVYVSLNVEKNTSLDFDTAPSTGISKINEFLKICSIIVKLH